MSVAKEFVDVLKNEKRGTQPYDTEATVKRINNGVAYVHIPGGVDETPVKLTINAKVGDTVQVRISNGSAWIMGNSSAPPTDDTTAKLAADMAERAKESATIAEKSAESAVKDAATAQAAAAAASESAAQAIEDAATAQTAAEGAQDSADAAQSSADAAQSSADAAASAASAADAKAVAAGQSAAAADAKAVAAGQSADAAAAQASAAQTSADAANTYANSALDQLGVVEDVVGVLDMLQRNGQYEVTKDLTPAGGKWYFTRTGSGTTADPYEYQVVVNPTTIEYVPSTDQTVEATKTYYERTGTGTSEDPYKYEPVEPVGTENPSTEGWYECTYYELVGIDEAIQNYVTSQLAVTDEGLWLKRPDSTGIQTKILLSSTEGVVLYGTNGQVVSKYGETAQIGNAESFHVEITGTELGFYQATNKVAYISNNQLYITQSVVLQQMDLGIPVADEGLGQWSWKVHENGLTPNRNNLCLKWNG